MEELIQQKMKRARRNRRLCGWMTLVCVLLVGANGILFAMDLLGWGVLVGSVGSLVVFGGLTYNNDRIMQGKRPWGE